MKTPILLVAGQRAHPSALARSLETGPGELVRATSCDAALEALAGQEFALVLIEPGPPADGLATLRRIGERGFGRRTPVILVAAEALAPAEQQAAYSYGAVDLLQGPLDTGALTAKVAVFAELFRARQAAKDSGALLDQEQRGAERDALRFQLLVESVKDYAIFILDPRGYVATWNAGAERIKGYRASEIIGKHFSAFYRPEDIADGKCERELEVASREGRFEEEGWRVRKDGSLLWASVTITALRDAGVLVGFAKVTRDLTERVLHEETLRHLAAEKAMLAEKARMQQFQERFIAVLGHDLRNPLAAINMGATLLRTLAANVPNEAGVRVLDRMQASSRRMSRMIEQILDLTRSRLAGGLEMEPSTIDLSTTISAIAEELRTAHPGRVIQVKAPASVVGLWDRDRLEQVFSNLIGNAVHYGHPGGPVDVEVVDGSVEVRVAVHNDGAPIPDALRAELFSPFRRGDRDSRTAETAGLGLGLYISREIVLAHGGEIDVGSSLAEGTTFRVTLPRRPPPAAEARP